MALLIGFLLALVSLPISFALGAAAGTAWTIAIIIFLVVGCGSLVITDDLDWFD